MKSPFLTLLFAGAMAACSSGPTGETGFYLGYHGGGVGYRTLWISISPTQAKVMLDVPELIVRRPAGFWRMGVSTVCDSEGTHEAVWQAPVASTPSVNGPLCPEPAVPGASDTLPQGSLDVSAGGEETHAGCDASTARILFLSPGYVADQYTHSQTEECEPRGGRWQDVNQVHPFQPDRPISLTAVFGDLAMPAYDSAATLGFEYWKKEGMNCPEPLADDEDSTSWSIDHIRGGWRPIANYNHSSGECAYLHEIALTLPDSITGDVALPADSWAALTQQIPNLKDVFLSPDGSLLVALTGEYEGSFHLAVYPVKAGRPLGQLLMFDLPATQTQVISAAWASGKSLAEWTHLLEGVRKTPLPLPKGRAG